LVKVVAARVPLGASEACLGRMLVREIFPNLKVQQKDGINISTGTLKFCDPRRWWLHSGLRALYELVDNGGMSGRACLIQSGFKNWNTAFGLHLLITFAEKMRW
jgi:hypothetical protein